MSLINQTTRWLRKLGALALFALPSAAAAQTTGVITGLVADSAGNPIVGARIGLDGSATVAVASGANGRYRMVGISAGEHTLRASLLGYRLDTKTVTVIAGQTVNVDFRMARAAVSLEAVVSTGYGTQTKATVTGAAEVISGEELQKRPVSNISKGLQGTMPGVQVRDFGGRPGSDGAEIRIRGVGTLNNASALVLVDGVPGEINNLDPLDIESVSVLKDAASAAIYGARAANGVVLIRTKRGKNTGTLNITYDAYVAQQEPQDLPQRVDIRTELEAVNAVYVNSGQTAKYTQGYIDSTAAGLDPVKYPNTNWLDVIYKKAPMVDQTVRVSGGNDLASLSLSLNAFNQQGMLNVENYYKRYTLRANTDFNISKRLTAAADLMMMNERVLRALGEGNAQFRALHDTPPTQVATYPDGTYGFNRSSFNPLAQLREEGMNNARWRTFSLNNRATYAFDDGIARGLKFNGYYTLDNKDNRALEFVPIYALTDRNSPTVVRRSNVRTRARDSRNTDFNTEIQATGEYDRSFWGSHTAKLLVGYDMRQSDNDNVFAERSGAYNNELELPGQGDASLQNTGSGASTSRLVGVFGRFNYNWKERYLFEANLRRDGSSRFGPNKKYGTFPSVSAAWRISEEPLFQRYLGFFDGFKLRGSWGRLGNDRIDNYLFQQTISVNSGNYNFGNALATGAIPGRIANPDIGWETTEQTNGGVDIEMMSGRLSFTGDVYKKITSGILLQIPMSSLVPGTAPVRNAAAVQNTGWESALNWNNSFRSLNYSIGVNLSDNKNRITQLPGGDQLGGTIRRVGVPLDAIYGIRAIGIFQSQAEVDSWATQVPGKTGPGDLKYADLNGDKKIDANDRTVLADRLPHYIWGANGSAQFKAFDFSVQFQGVGRQYQYMDGALIEGPTWENFYPKYLLDNWTPTNTDAAFPRFVFRSDHNHNAPGRNSWWVRDTRYATLKNINLGYTLPTGLVRRSGLNTARIYIAGSNVYTWSKMKGLLPSELRESNPRGDYYYQTRNFSIGTSLGL